MIGELLQQTYRVERLIGEGRMGKVYEASHLRLPRRFAIKVMLPGFADNPEAMKRFRREAELTSRLGHHNIVEVVDFNQTDAGEHYIVMELLDGLDLSRFLQQVRRPGLPQVAGLLLQAAAGLQAAHDQGVVHRDLKPSNLFICHRAGRPDVVKLVDFGISKMLDGTQSQLTVSASLLGTPAYMAPEQAEGGSVDHRTDVYALGAMLYEMVTGERPFVASSPLAVLYKVVNQEPTPPCQVRPDLGPAVEAVVVRAMSKDRDRRFATTLELAAAFTDAIDEEPSAQIIHPGTTEPTRPTSDSPPEEAAVQVPAPLSASVDAPQRPSRARWALMVALGLLGVGGALIVYLQLGDDHGRPSADAAGANAAPVSRAPATGPAADHSLPPRDARTAVAIAPTRWLTVTSLPAGAQIFVDGELVGPTPLDRAPMRRGAVELEVRKPGYRIARLPVAGAEDVRHTIRLVPVKRPARLTGVATLRVTSLADGRAMRATIHIDGVQRGSTPLYLDNITVGRHTIEARRSGFRHRTQRVTVRPGRENSVVFHLRR